MTISPHTKKRVQGCHPKRANVEPLTKERTTPIVPRPISLPLTRSVPLTSGGSVALVTTDICLLGVGIEDNGTMHIGFLTIDAARQLAAHLIELATDMEADMHATAWSRTLFLSLTAT